MFYDPYHSSIDPEGVKTNRLVDVMRLLFIAFNTIFLILLLILQSLIWIWLENNFWRQIQLLKTSRFKKTVIFSASLRSKIF